MHHDPALHAADLPGPNDPGPNGNDPEASGSVDDAELFEPIHSETDPDLVGSASDAADSSRDSTAMVLPQGYPEVDALPGTDDPRPWMICVVDEVATKALAEELKTLLADRLRIFVAATVQSAEKQLQIANQQGHEVAVVLSEEPFAGMVGGGFWAMQKCRSLAPNAIRLLVVERYDSLISLGLAKLRDSDVHQVLSASTPASDIAARLILPMLSAPEDGVDETLRSATIRAKSDVRVLKIPKETFADLLRRDAQLSIGITRELARRLRKIQNQ